MKLANTEVTPTTEIMGQMLEPRPLPMGRMEFEQWSDRIISGALIPGVNEEDPKALVQSQKFALANMLMHLGPTESHKPDAHFIHQLRKVVINQVAHSVSQEYRDEAKARIAAEEAKKGEETLKRAERVMPEDNQAIKTEPVPGMKRNKKTGEWYFPAKAKKAKDETKQG